MTGPDPTKGDPAFSAIAEGASNRLRAIFQADDPVPEAVTPVHAPSPTSDRAMILLVDDRPDKMIAIEAAIEGLGDEVVRATSGSAALRHLLLHDFAVILLDVSMPVMDGFETATLIRQRKANEHTPIIFITAMNASEGKASVGYSLGAVDYLFAPVLPDVLRAKVAVFIDLFRKTSEVRRQGDLLRVAAERRTITLESRLDGLLNRLNVGVFLTTAHGDLLSANPAFFRIYGLSPTILPGSVNLGRLYLQETDRALMMAQLMATGQVLDFDIQHRRADGVVIWVSLSKALSNVGDGHSVIEGLVEDITERKEAERTVIAQSEDLARSNAELGEFAYIASHDLQEPLRMVSSFSSLVSMRCGDKVDDTTRSYLDQIVSAAARMRTLIRDILAYSSLGKPAAPVQVDCDELLDKVLFGLQARIDGAEIRRTPLPVVMGDPVLLGQLFENLVTNALKFRASGILPVITIGALRQGADWQFVIADNGIGIDPQYHERIFRVFQRLHTTEEFPGTGIGLAICRKAVERLGGRLTLESSLGHGSTFRFTLPYTPQVVGGAKEDPGLAPAA